MDKSTKSGNLQEPSPDASETEEQDDTSSEQQDDIEVALSSFRERWQKELKVSNNKRKNRRSKIDSNKENLNIEEQAKIAYLNGVEMEKTGKMYEAIKYYRRAVQLIPDIEFRMSNMYKNKPFRTETVSENTETDKENNNSCSEESDDDDDEEIKENELLFRIQRKIAKLSAFCTAKFEQKATHISVLPTEMILYILRWLVSSDLDLKSLEMCAMVCRGFYLCARDPEIWRLACLRVWGLNCGSSPENYLSWRQMFIDRSRVHFNGCYIGKTTYIRHGENSFQDQFYRPWHLVAYYRYLRFFPEGVVLVLTSSDEPAQCVGQMKYQNARSPILKGYYRLKDDKVTLIVHRDNKGYKSNKRRDNLQDLAEQTFHMELQIKNIKNKKHFQLVWTHYSIFTRTIRGDENTCNIDIGANKFPPFWFSRVKSFTAESDYPLQ